MDKLSNLCSEALETGLMTWNKFEKRFTWNIKNSGRIEYKSAETYDIIESRFRSSQFSTIIMEEITELPFGDNDLSMVEYLTTRLRTVQDKCWQYNPIINDDGEIEYTLWFAIIFFDFLKSNK
ncbi:MAG: hypothetical protein CfClM3_0893 [Methanobrevibacter sp. CfCl-M3]